MTHEKPMKILFVCSGNLCRSPMAEGLAKSHAKQYGYGVEVRSAGVLGIENHPPEPNSVAVMSEMGIDISEHTSQPLTAELIDWADYILVMELAHATQIREMAPESRANILQLGAFGGLMDIHDPMGGWKRRFRQTRDDLARCVENFMGQLPPSYRNLPAKTRPSG